MVKVSVPSRICLFGEHQDYLGLEVIAAAVNLYFTAKASPREDHMLHIRIRDEKCGGLNAQSGKQYQNVAFDLTQPLVYTGKREYMKSVVNVLNRKGITVTGADVEMDSDIPIERGMCSSTAMVMALMAALAAVSGKKLTPAELASFAWEAEVKEFNEPGGMMDQYTAALGGLVHLDFSGETKAELLPAIPSGCFILFDSMQPKDTLAVLTSAKTPTLEGMRILKGYGIGSIRDLASDPVKERQISRLPASIAAKVRANVDNYRLGQKALRMMRDGDVDPHQLGGLLNREQLNLRIGLGVSTPVIDRALETAISAGAYGGKVNGSGGGGCLYVYAPEEKYDAIIEAVGKLGLPGKKLTLSDGVRFERSGS